MAAWGFPGCFFMPQHWTERRVVITGLGVVASLGKSVDEFWANIITGKCGIHRIQSFDPTDFDCQIAAEVTDFDPTPAFPSPKEVRRTDRFSQMMVVAAREALLNSKLDLNKVNLEEVGVFLGSGIGGLRTVGDQHTVFMTKGPGRLSPFMIPMLILNMGSGLFSIFHNLKGPNLATCSACATSTHAAIGEAWRTLKMGDAQVMFAGGSERNEHHTVGRWRFLRHEGLERAQ